MADKEWRKRHAIENCIFLAEIPSKCGRKVAHQNGERSLSVINCLEKRTFLPKIIVLPRISALVYESWTWEEAIAAVSCCIQFFEQILLRYIHDHYIYNRSAIFKWPWQGLSDGVRINNTFKTIWVTIIVGFCDLKFWLVSNSGGWAMYNIQCCSSLLRFRLRDCLTGMIWRFSGSITV